MLFQFHQGTIEGESGTDYRPSRIHFNSTKVLLREIRNDANSTRLAHFNSTKVLLRVNDEFCSFAVRFQFQFHQGTIEGFLVYV